MLVWSLVSVALAHPVGMTAATHTLSLVVRPDRIEVGYWVDVPNEFLMGRRAGPDPVAAMAVELASGLLLTADGRVLSMHLETQPTPAPSSEHTTGYAYHLAAALPDGPLPHHLELSTANLQEASNLFAQDLQVDPSIRVVGCSVLARTKEGRIARDDTLRWRRGDDARTLSVELAGRWPGWWRWLAPRSGIPGEPVRAAKALLPAPRDLLRPTVLTPWTWLGALPLSLLLGVTVGRSRAVPWLLLALLGAVLGVLLEASSGWVELALGALALGALAALPRWAGALWLAGALSAAGLAATCHHTGPGLGMALVFGGGALLGAQPRPRGLVVGVLLAVILLLVRGSAA